MISLAPSLYSSVPVQRGQKFLPEDRFIRNYGLSVHLIFLQAMHGGSARWEVLF